VRVDAARGGARLMSRCMVTGGAGFIGRHLVEALRDAGHEVGICDIQPTLTSLPSDVIDDLVNLDGYDVVFHLAAVSRTVPAIQDPVECIRTNALGTAHVLECARRAHVPRVVVSSSNVVYAGATPYRDSKIAVENLCETYAGLYGRSVAALRYSNVYGPGIPQGDPAVFAMLRDSYRRAGYAEVTGDGGQSRDFTHVSDIVRGNMLAWESDHRGVVDLCTGRQTTINRACGLLGIPVRHVAERPGDVRMMVQDPKPAGDLLGWRARVELEDGITDIWRT